MYRSTAITLAAIFATSLATGANAEQTLILTCGGGGTAVKPDVAVTQGSNDFNGSINYNNGRAPTSFNGTGSYDQTTVRMRDKNYADQVDVEINGTESRIRLPRTTLPPVHGGTGGWFQLKDVRINDREIDGSAGVNFVNRPKVHIDRVTGTISIHGINGDYIGQCQAVRADTVAKF